jgi:phosphate transport system substrate-binding protein
MRSLAFLATALVFIAPIAAASEELRYVGSSTIGMGVLNIGATAAFEKITGTRFVEVDNSGSGRGVEALLRGETPLAGTSRLLTAEEKKMNLIGKVIGYDAIAVFVHVDNPVESLTRRELREIFTGQITNWGQVGGRSAPIIPTTEILTGNRATVEMFQEIVMDGAKYGPGFKEIDLPRDQIIHLASEVNGICAVSVGLLATVPAEFQKKVKAVGVNGIRPNYRSIKHGAYLISRPMLLVTRGPPDGAVKDFVRFMTTGEGQGFVARNFLPVQQ